METIQQPSVLAMPFANNGTKNEIPSAPTGNNKASLSEGFPLLTSTSIAEGGVPPERADMNALGNIATAFYYFMQCGGAYTFRTDVSNTIGGYPKGALLWYIPTVGIPNLLTSTINNNTNNFNTDQSVIGEAGSGKPWEIVTVSGTNFMDLLTNQTANGVKTFTSSPIVPTLAITDNSQNVASTGFVKNILTTIYPVGSIYIGTQSVCPMSLVMPDTSWNLVSSGKALWTGTGSNANTTINAGLPNITGSFKALQHIDNTTVTGAFTKSAGVVHTGSSHTSARDVGGTINFNASRSSSIYGGSSTVQPPAYVVNVWRRTA